MKKQEETQTNNAGVEKLGTGSVSRVTRQGIVREVAV